MLFRAVLGCSLFFVTQLAMPGIAYSQTELELSNEWTVPVDGDTLTPLPFEELDYEVSVDVKNVSSDTFDVTLTKSFEFKNPVSNEWEPALISFGWNPFAPPAPNADNFVLAPGAQKSFKLSGTFETFHIGLFRLKSSLHAYNIADPGDAFGIEVDSSSFEIR